MTNKELIDKIQSLYAEARDTDYSDLRIHRGRKHSISSKVEDLFAFFLLKRLNNNNIMFWVDYPLSYKSISKQTKKGNPKTITIYPDIAIVKDNIITDIIDLKLDLGWKRNLKPVLHNALLTVNELRKKQIGAYKPLIENGEKSQKSISVNFSNQLDWHIIVISDQNITSSAMKENETVARKLSQNSALNFYILTRKEHPNGGNPSIQDNEIDLLIKNLL